MKRMRKMILLGMLLGVLWMGSGLQTEAKELEGSYIKQTGTDLVKLNDGSNQTGYSFRPGDEIKVTAKDGSTISGVYILWDSPVKEWGLMTAEGKIFCGQNEFLHEYVPLDIPQTEVTIHLYENVSICEISIFDEGELPEWVQIWQPSCEKADILLVSSHADDEILFFGGIMPTYIPRGADIQVIYMTECWSTARVREHEKLDGLWASGLDIYPVCGNFTDLYSKTLERARIQYDEQSMVDYLTKQFRRFKPQVVVTHDFNGEYGHGYHMLTAAATVQALEAAASDTAHVQSLEQYGVWDVPKTYIHLYGENTIEMDLRIPLEEYGGKTALEVAAAAYKQHVSQQWCWFYVDDEYEYSCDEFGLFRTNVGVDTTNDMLENIVTYSEQARLEAERIEAERLEAERKAAEEAARLQAEKEAEEKRLAEEKAAAEEAARLEAERKAAEEAAKLQAEKNQKILTAAIVAGVLLTVVIVLFYVRLQRVRKGKKDKNR